MPMREPRSTEPLLRSRAAQLADYLRGCIGRGELAEPLPGIRDWSARLGVGHNTLEAALKILETQGLVTVRSRQRVRLVKSGRRIANEVMPHRVVRWVYYGDPTYDSAAWAELFVKISERLGEHGIQLVVERCSAGRLRALRDAGEQSGQMLLLGPMGERDRYQPWFADFRRSALIIGLPRRDVPLPYVTADVESAVEHAVQSLSRRGIGRICLVMPKHSARTPIEELFLRFCSQARPPVEPELFGLPFDSSSQGAALDRFVRRVHGRLGLVLIYPVPTSLLMIALLKRGLDVPGQIELIPMNTMLHNTRVLPVPVYYPYPVEALARTITRAAVRYFQHGRVPKLRKRIPLKAVKKG